MAKGRSVQDLQGLRRRLAAVATVSLAPGQNLGNAAAHRFFVIHHQNPATGLAFLHHNLFHPEAMGRKTRKVEPTPTWLSTSTEPRWASMRPLTRDRPKPVPMTCRVLACFTR